MTSHGDTQRIITEIEALFAQAVRADDELQASLARYACVLASSYLEAAFRDLILSYTRQRASPQVLRYIDVTLRTFRDPNTDKILQLVGRLEPEFRRLLEDHAKGRPKDSVDSISANRNNIAHGRRSGISLGRVRTYYEDAKGVVSKAKSIMSI